MELIDPYAKSFTKVFFTPPLIENKQIIREGRSFEGYSTIPGHGKGEVDHVGGTAKVTIRRMAAAGRTFINATDIVDALKEKYADSTTTRYCIKEISEEELQTSRKEARH